MLLIFRTQALYCRNLQRRNDHEPDRFSLLPAPPGAVQPALRAEPAAARAAGQVRAAPGQARSATSQRVGCRLGHPARAGRHRHHTGQWGRRMTVLHLDFECYSHLDLKAVGVENYVRSPGFVVTVVGWAFDDEPPQSVVWPNAQLPMPIREHIAKGGTVKAWNAAFEFNILNLHYNVAPTHEQFDCVMQRALAYGLPGKLETAGPAMGLAIVKDATARRLMLSMGKAKKDGTTWHVTDPAKLKDLAAYCEQDVWAERALDKVIPPLHQFERRL